MTLSAANDNAPKEHLVGAGNLPWVVGEHFGKLTNSEIFTASRPLRIMHEIVSQAVEMMRTDTAAQGCGCVYVIGDVYGRECKIGKALDPVKRLAQLQTGNPNQLFLHRVFWLKRAQADKVEMWSHQAAERLYVRLHGEWFQCSPDQAHLIILNSIIKSGWIKSYSVMTPTIDLMEVAS